MVMDYNLNLKFRVTGNPSNDQSSTTFLFVCLFACLPVCLLGGVYQFKVDMAGPSEASSALPMGPEDVLGWTHGPCQQALIDSELR